MGKLLNAFVFASELKVFGLLSWYCSSDIFAFTINTSIYIITDTISTQIEKLPEMCRSQHKFFPKKIECTRYMAQFTFAFQLSNHIKNANELFSQQMHSFTCFMSISIIFFIIFDSSFSLYHLAISFVGHK